MTTMSDSRRPHRGRVLARLAAAFIAAATAGVTAAPPAHAGLLGGTLGLVGGVVDDTLGLVGSILTPGWDDNAQTPAVRMSTVADAVGANDLWARGIDG